jgi:hypothetical protein
MASAGDFISVSLPEWNVRARGSEEKRGLSVRKKMDMGTRHVYLPALYLSWEEYKVIFTISRGKFGMSPPLLSGVPPSNIR